MNDCEQCKRQYPSLHLYCGNKPECKHGNRWYCGLCEAELVAKCKHGNPWYCGFCGLVPTTVAEQETTVTSAKPEPERIYSDRYKMMIPICDKCKTPDPYADYSEKHNAYVCFICFGK